MKQSVLQSVSFDLPIAAKKTCRGNVPLFKGNPFNCLQHSLPRASLLGSCHSEGPGRALLGARRSLGFQDCDSESAGLGSVFWGPEIAGHPAAGLRAKERISQSSRSVCYLVNLSLKVCTRGKHFHSNKIKINKLILLP